jgi:hypothetical protein
VKLVRSALLVAVALALPLVPSAAEANRYTHVDATGDVVQSTNGSGFTPASDRVVGDIAYTTITHKRRNVLMRIQYRDLVPDTEINGHLFTIKTPSMRRDVTLVATKGAYGGRAFMSKPSGKKVTCHVKRTIDYTINRATVKVPRSCLGNPRWVKVGMAGVFLTGLGSSDVQYIDDAQTAGTLGTGPKLSPKVKR